MKSFKVPNTYVIIFTVIAICAMTTWFVPGGNPQTWQIFSALYEGFSQQAGIIAFVLIIGISEISSSQLSKVIPYNSAASSPVCSNQRFAGW